MSVRRVIALLAAGLVVAGAPAAVAASAQAQPTATATVSVLHAVPGATVDVYANGKALLTNFKPGTLTDPVQLPAGAYDLKVTKAGAGAKGAALIQANDVNVPGGANITVVAHLSAAGKPVLTPYVNDVSKLAAGKARLTVRHDAAAPAVDVRAGGKPVFEGLTNPKEVKADLPAGTVKADVVLAGTSTVAIGPADVNLKEGTNTIVYAWGSASGKNLKLAVQTISGLHGNPSGIPGGTGGQAAAQDTSTSSPWLTGVLGLAGLGVIGFGATAIRARARS
ncbi:DUF4397 domain-containing protein [Kribbella sp. NPDC058693]|uniref:DUF4397 domain-containing protein n=1 Tax=Kribbella sp. NPDC058693 TaxID=3346602 RepID=UPI00365650D3